MTRVDLESTARISREELSGLLETMPPIDQQRITARIEPGRSFTTENWDELLTSAASPRARGFDVPPEPPRVRFVSMRVPLATPIPPVHVQAQATPTRWSVVAMSFLTTFMAGIWAIYFFS